MSGEPVSMIKLREHLEAERRMNALKKGPTMESTGKKPENEDKDLEWQREDESDNMQKSERPDKDYMNDRNLCQNCQGVKRICERGDCPQKIKAH